MNVLFNSLFYLVKKYGDPDKLMACLRASMLLAWAQTCNLTSVLLILDDYDLISIREKVSEGYTVVAIVIFAILNMILLKVAKRPSRRQKVITLIYWVMSVVVMAYLFASTD